MPPRPKFTKDHVLQAALGIVRQSGETALTARSLGEALGSSPRPIFTLFASMEELKSELVVLASGVFYDHCANYRDFRPAFKQIGMSIVSFAAQEPHLFAFLFMSARAEHRSLDDWCTSELGNEAIRLIGHDYALEHGVAQALFKEMWLHSFALCVLQVTGAAELTMQEVSDSLSRAFLGLYSLARAGALTQAGIKPAQDAGELGAEPPCVDVIKPPGAAGTDAGAPSQLPGQGGCAGTHETMGR